MRDQWIWVFVYFQTPPGDSPLGADEVQATETTTPKEEKKRKREKRKDLASREALT